MSHTKRPGIALFCMLAELGAILPTFKLAKELKRRGFEVAYLGSRFAFGPTLVSLRKLITLQGFRYLTPEHDFDAFKICADFWRIRKGEKPFSAEEIRQDNAEFVDYLEHLGRFLSRMNPSALFFEPHLSWMGLIARRFGIPHIGLAPNLRFVSRLDAPPIVYPSHISVRPLSLFQNAVLWSRLAAFTRLQRYTVGLERFGVLRTIKRLARQLNVGWRFSDEIPLYPRLVLPEAVLAPREMDLSHPSDRLYLGVSVDDTRMEALHEDFGATGPSRDERGTPPDNRFVFCSLGTHPEFQPGYERFVPALLEVCRRHPSWHFVFHVGTATHVIEGVDLPTNLTSRPRVDQLAMLRKAALVMTHGGFGTIKECAWFGVPMLILPADGTDQHGNALRMERLGVAIQVPLKSVTASKLLDATQRLLDDNDFATRASALRNRLREREAPAFSRAVDIIEEHLDSYDPRTHVDPMTAWRSMLRAPASTPSGAIA